MFLIILRLKLFFQSDGKENGKLCMDDSFDMCQDQTTQSPQLIQSPSAVQIQSENKSPTVQSPRTFSPSIIFNNPFLGFFNKNKPNANIEKSISERKIEDKEGVCNDVFYDAKEELFPGTNKVTKTTKESKNKW